MGTTLQAIVEVEVDGVPGVTRWVRSWDSVCSWEFNKSYDLMSALSDCAEVADGWPGDPRCRDRADDPQRSWARIEVDEADVAHDRQCASVTAMRLLVEHDDALASPRFVALFATVQALAIPYGEERVRVLFYRT